MRRLPPAFDKKTLRWKDPVTGYFTKAPRFYLSEWRKELLKLNLQLLFFVGIAIGLGLFAELLIIRGIGLLDLFISVWCHMPRFK